MGNGEDLKAAMDAACESVGVPPGSIIFDQRGVEVIAGFSSTASSTSVKCFMTHAVTELERTGMLKSATPENPYTVVGTEVSGLITNYELATQRERVKTMYSTDEWAEHL